MKRFREKLVADMRAARHTDKYGSVTSPSGGQNTKTYKMFITSKRKKASPASKKHLKSKNMNL